MKIYHYHRDTEEYWGEGEAHESPLEPGIFLVPAYATELEPPITGENEVAVFENGAWEIKADFRGVYYETSRLPVEVFEIGEYPPVGCTKDPLPLTAEEILQQKWEMIKAERDRRMNGGIKVGFHFFHSDTGSRIQHLGLKDEVRDMLAEGKTLSDFVIIDGEHVVWKTMSGEFVPLTGQYVLDIVAGGKILDKQLFKCAEVHRATMMASSDPGIYDFSTGWPEAFEG